MAPITIVIPAIRIGKTDHSFKETGGNSVIRFFEFNFSAFAPMD